MNILLGKESVMHHRKQIMQTETEKIKILFFLNYDEDTGQISSVLNAVKLKFTSRCVNRRKDFYKAIQNFNPSVIIADNTSGELDGLNVVRYIKKQKIEIPVIIITDEENKDEAIKCLREGAKDYFLKTNLSLLPKSVYDAVKIVEQNPENEDLNSKLFNFNKIYEHLLDTLGKVNTGFLIIDSADNEILFVNDAFCKICQYETSEIYEQVSLLKLIDSRHTEGFKKEINNVLKPENPIHIFNSVLVRKDEKKVNVEFTARQFVMNNQAQIILIVRDITEIISKNLMNKLSEEALLESERRYRSMIENVKDYAIFMLDFNGRIIRWNAGAQRIFGYEESEIILKKLDTFFPVENKNGINSTSIMEQAKKSGHVETEVQLFKKNKTKVWTSLTITRLDDKNSETGIYSVIIHDLTKNKISEEQLHEQEVQLRSLAKHLQDAREEERLRIARELHDEFSQMLTVLRMDLTVLSHTISKIVTEPLKRISLMEKISSISELLEKTIRSTRRIITELRPAVLDELGLYTAIQWQAQEFENRTGIRCKIVKLKQDINFDRNTSTAIFRILQEGLTNVAKHSGATAVVISLSIINNELQLEIKDNGKGIDDSKLKAPTSTGLLGIRERVMAFNGNFEIHSEKDKGTRLMVSVPFKEDN